MDKQRISNIPSSVQMSPRDRKDFIEELSKLGQGGAGGGAGEGGGTGEVSTEHPVRIIDVYPEEQGIQNISLGITFKEYVNSYIIIRIREENNVIVLHRKYTRNLIGNQFSDVYVGENKGIINNKYFAEIHYSNTTSEDDIMEIYIINVVDPYNDVAFVLDISYPDRNKIILDNISLYASYGAILVNYNDTVTGNYYNGTFIGFNNGKIQRYDVNSETGEITLQQSINPELIGTVAKLEVGDADDICQRNLELINMAITQAGANHFDVDIDYGVGSATFTQGLADDAIAGTATIIVATGYVTKYNLYGNGKVEKVGNDIDLFALEARIAALEGA